MTREEMIARGLTPEETKHHGHRRALFHDYNRPGIYMVTLVTEGRRRVFGNIVGHTRGMRGTSDFPHLQCSALGRAVLQEEVAKISQHYPMVRVGKVALMPDHIHLLVIVKEKLPQGKHLGNIVRGFKTGCTRAWWRLQEEPCEKSQGTVRPPVAMVTPVAGTVNHTDEAQGTVRPPVAMGGVTVPEACPSGMRPLLFQKGYHDRIIMNEDTLENIHRYMDENPFRAKLKEECPNIMQRRLHLWIQGREYAAFGNLFLLKNPDKQQVFFHRRTPQGMMTHLTAEYAHEKERLLRRAEEGMVLVTPGISKGEQGVVDAALTYHLPLIILQKEPITEFWKPSQRRFYACASGCLLILSPWTVEGNSDYARFHLLNDLASEVCVATDTRLVGALN